MEGPVRIEIAIDIKCPEFEDRFAAFEPPPSAGDLHAVFDQVATRAFDDARSDRLARVVADSYPARSRHGVSFARWNAPDRATAARSCPRPTERLWGPLG